MNLERRDQAGSPASTGGLPLSISHAEMDAACACGAAAPFGPSLSWLTRYQDAWWVVWEAGWLRITDDLTIADIDARAQTHPQDPTSGTRHRKADAEAITAVAAGKEGHACHIVDHHPPGDAARP
jgi:hypothetical protein